MIVSAAAILFNTATCRYHPIVYRPAPMPGGFDNGETPTTFRVKSLGHHTEGFATLEEARNYINTADHIKEAPVKELDTCLEWNGQDIPAGVGWISNGQFA